MVNVVAVGPVASGNLRISAAGTSAEGGVVNFGPGNTGAGTNSNAVPVALSSGGAVDVFVNSSAGTPATNVRLVVLGYYIDPALGTNALGFVPVSPCAIYDTRQSTGVAAGQTTLPAQITGSVTQPGTACADHGVVPANAAAVMVNVVAVGPVASGNLRISASGTDAEGGVVNFGPGNTGAGTNSNAVPVALSASGAVDVFVNSTAGTPATNVRLVVLGYYIDPTLNTNALGFVPVSPCAIYDTRDGAGIASGQATLPAQITGTVTQPDTACAATGVVPTNAAAVMVNVVAVGPVASGNLRISASGTTAEGGVVNFGPGNTGAGTNSNAVPVALSTNGALDVFVNSTAGAPATNVRLVVLGYYT